LAVCDTDFILLLLVPFAEEVYEWTAGVFVFVGVNEEKSESRESDIVKFFVSQSKQRARDTRQSSPYRGVNKT
jgi:hypothetical protein